MIDSSTRFFGLDIHKEYLVAVAGGQDAQGSVDSTARGT